MKSVLLISGPIGSGKTSVVSLVADQLTDTGSRAKFFDIDSFVNVIDPHDSSKVEAERLLTWQQARRAVAASVLEAYGHGASVAVVAGPFFEESALHEMHVLLGSWCQLYLYDLRVPLEQRIKRVGMRKENSNVGEVISQMTSPSELNRTVQGVSIQNDGLISDTAQAIIAAHRHGIGGVGSRLNTGVAREEVAD